MRKVIFQSLMILLLNASFFAQTEDKNPELIDEFGAIALDDNMARFDYAIYKLQDRSDGKMHIRIYGGETDSFPSAYYRGALTEAYLKNNRKLSPERFSIEYCNFNKEELRTRIYLVSRGEKLPKCANDIEIPAKTTGFGSVHFYNPKFEFLAIEDSAVELGFSQGEYSKIVFNVLKSFLEKTSESKVYVIAYLQAEFEKDESGKVIKKKIDEKSLAPKMIQAAKNELIKNGFNNSQIELIDGGYVAGEGERRLEFYFVPKNGEIPKPKPDYFPKKSRK